MLKASVDRVVSPHPNEEACLALLPNIQRMGEAVRAVVHRGMSQAEAIECFGVQKGTLSKWLQKREMTQQGTKRKRLDEDEGTVRMFTCLLVVRICASRSNLSVGVLLR